MNTGDGPTYRLVWAAYLTAFVGALALAGLLTTAPSSDTVAMVVIFGGSGLLALIGTVLGLRGVPRRFAPRQLYASRLRLLPMLVGVALATGATTLLLTHFALFGSPAPALALISGGLVVTGAGGLIALLAANAEARARLDSVEPIEWRARPDRGRRRQWYGVGVALAIVLVALAVATREFYYISFAGYPVIAWAQAETDRHYWLTDDELLYGNTNAYRILDRGDIVDVRYADGSLRIERRGWRPALTCDTSDIDDPEQIRTALR